MKKFFRKGSGEMLGLTYVTVFIVILFIFMCTLFQLSFGLYDVNKMLMSSSRAAAVCTSMEDAQKQAELVAESTSNNRNVNHIETNIKYADGFSKWKSGASIIVTVKAKVKIMGTVFKSRTYSKSIPVTIENLDGFSGSNLQEQIFNYLKQNGFTDEAACAVLGNIEQECNTWNPKQVQIDGGWAAGLFQLENYRLKSGRWKNLDTFAKARGKSWDDASSQLDFMIYEASGGEPFIANNIKKYYSDGFNGFKQETDIDKATTVFEKAYEIAGNAYLQNRITAAHRYYNQFHR